MVSPIVTPTIPQPPPGLVLAQTPGTKPGRASQQQSFLSGAVKAQGQGPQGAGANTGGGATGKTLIGS